MNNYYQHLHPWQTKKAGGLLCSECFVRIPYGAIHWANDYGYQLCDGCYQAGLTKERAMNETVTISSEEYKQLVADQKLLHALEGAGVDNWVGYDYAMEILENEEDECHVN